MVQKDVKCVTETKVYIFYDHMVYWYNSKISDKYRGKVNMWRTMATTCGGDQKQEFIFSPTSAGQLHCSTSAKANTVAVCENDRAYNSTSSWTL